MIDDVLAMLAAKIQIRDEVNLLRRGKSVSNTIIPNQIFVMAHGYGSRWNGQCHSTYKHLLPVGKGGTPIVVRTVHQLKHLEQKDITVFAPHDYWGLFWIEDVSMLSVPMEGIDSILTGILFTEFLWKRNSHLIFLLGDDIFEYDLLKKIVQTNYPQAVLFGRKSGNPSTGKPNREFYALKVPLEHRESFVEKFFPIVFNPELFKLFHLPAVMDNLGVEYWDGWTGDLDSFEEYEAYYHKMCILAQRDDEEHLNG